MSNKQTNIERIADRLLSAGFTEAAKFVEYLLWEQGGNSTEFLLNYDNGTMLCAKYKAKLHWFSTNGKVMK